MVEWRLYFREFSLLFVSSQLPRRFGLDQVMKKFNSANVSMLLVKFQPSSKKMCINFPCGLPQLSPLHLFMLWNFLYALSVWCLLLYFHKFRVWWQKKTGHKNTVRVLFVVVFQFSKNHFQIYFKSCLCSTGKRANVKFNQS